MSSDRRSPDSPFLDFVNLRRLLAGGLLVALIALPLYVLVLRDDTSDIQAGALLDTPPVDGRNLPVGVQEGHLAPDFVLASATGGTYRLSELRGRPVLIKFWATWCGSCLAELPEVKALQAQIGVENLTVLAVNAGESRNRALEFVNHLGAPFAWALDPSMAVTDAYGVFGLPLSVFIDSAGVVQAVYHGHATGSIMQQLVQAAIDAEPPGELPFTLRMVNPIPRERVLAVSRRGSDRLEIEGRTLRCDASYCAEPALASLRALDGVRQVELKASRGEPVLTVRFDARVVNEDRVLAALTAALEANGDPVYRGPLEVRRSGS